MTDRIAALTLILDSDVREDDIERLVSACRMLAGVCDVKKNLAEVTGTVIAKSRLKFELAETIMEFLK